MQKSLKISMNIIKRELEIVTEAFQGLQQLASYNDGKCSAVDVGKAMVPLIFELEGIQSRVDELCEENGFTPKMPDKPFEKLTLVEKSLLP